MQQDEITKWHTKWKYILLDNLTTLFTQFGKLNKKCQTKSKYVLPRLIFYVSPIFMRMQNVLISTYLRLLMSSLPIAREGNNKSSADYCSLQVVANKPRNLLFFLLLHFQSKNAPSLFKQSSRSACQLYIYSWQLVMINKWDFD